MFTGVLAQGSGTVGLNAGNDAVVRDSSVTANAADGIVASAGSLIRRDTLQGNAGGNVLNGAHVGGDPCSGTTTCP